MSVIEVDILGPLPLTDNQNLYIVVCGDYFTKWKEAFPIPNQTAAVVADKLVTEVFFFLNWEPLPKFIQTKGDNLNLNCLRISVGPWGSRKLGHAHTTLNLMALSSVLTEP